MIEVEGLTRYYGTKAAVLDVSVTIAEREIVGFLGLNGAGKSTMLKLLAGLLLPSAGTIRISGTDASSAPDALRRKIGYLPDDPPLYREMRVREFLSWCGQIKGCSRREVEARLPDVLDTCQLKDVADAVIDELSFGFRKRVGIAQAIVHAPDLVILDEPISGLDPVQIVEMRHVVKRLGEHSTVLVSSHILSEIEQTCDRLFVLHGGKLVAEGSETELAARLGTRTRLDLRVRGDHERLIQFLRARAWVEHFELDAGANGLHAVVVALGEDRREQLVSELVGDGFGLRKLDDARAELEDIFLRLTEQDAQPNREVT